MEYKIILNPDYTNVSKVGIKIIPENDSLKFTLSKIRLINYPKFIIDISIGEGYGEEYVSIKSYNEVDWEDQAWIKSVMKKELEAGEIFIHHEVMGETIILESIFNKILYDYGSKLLEVYGEDETIQEKYQEYWNWYFKNVSYENKVNRKDYKLFIKFPKWKDAMEQSLKQLKNKASSKEIELTQNKNIKNTVYSFFDGLKLFNDVLSYNDWLSSTDFSLWSNSYVELNNKKIYLIKENVKALSTFSHFNKEELESLAKQYELEIKEENGIYYAYTFNHNSRQLEISENNDLIVIYSINGDRVPESIFIYGVYEK